MEPFCLQYVYLSVEFCGVMENARSANYVELKKGSNKNNYKIINDTPSTFLRGMVVEKPWNWLTRFVRRNL